MPKRTLTSEEVAQQGMKTNHEQMDNGEYRLRLMNEQDGSGYIRTVAGPEGAWQNSHFHTGVREFISVQKGWMAYVYLVDDGFPFHVTIVRQGQYIVSEPHVPHNIYMPAGAVTHCVKFGDTDAEKASGKADWHAAISLDARVKFLSEKQILQLEDVNFERAKK